jgi:hypothetical protein
VLAAYIRDVTPGPARAATLAVVADELRDAKSQLVVIAETTAAAQHAAQAGWISEVALQEMLTAPK